MKRIITMFSILMSLVLLVVSCGGSKATEGEQTGDMAEKKEVAIVYSVGGKGDKSFNDAAFRGLDRVQKELGISYKEYEPKDVSSESENALRQFAESGEYEIIIGVGFTIKDSLTAVAEAFPEQKFAIIDDQVELPNVVSLKFKEEEGSFLMGALAAMMSKTGSVGFIGAMETPLIKRFHAGYAQGAKYVNPNINVASVYLGGSNPFNDPASSKAKSETLIQQGADVLYAAAGASGAGMFQAIKEKGVYGIGVDSNQDDIVPGQVLTSMMKYVDVAVFDTIKAAFEGKFDGGKLKEFGIKEDGVGTTDFAFTKDKIGPEKIKRLEEIKEEIKAGKIVVEPTLK